VPQHGSQKTVPQRHGAAPIFMIRAVVKTWKTSYVINDAGGTNQLTASGCLEFGNQQFHK